MLSGSSTVVNKYHNDNLVPHTTEDTGIERQRNATHLSKGFSELLEPGEWCLVDSIESLVELKNLPIVTDTRWGYHRDFFHKISIQECRFDMQLMSLVAKVSRQGNDVTKVVKPDPWCKCLFIVEAFDLGIPLSYDSCLVSFHGSI